MTLAPGCPDRLPTLTISAPIRSTWVVHTPVRAPAAVQIRYSISAVVDLPLVPVIATMRAPLPASWRWNTSVSPITSIPAARALPTEGGTKAVDDISFEIKEGEFITVLGSSGSGKTTTLKMINRLIREDTGHITFFGEDISGMNEVDLRRKIGYVVQQVGLFPHMTVAQNIATVPELLKWDKKEIQARIKELLELVQLDPNVFADRKPKQLSGGQQQRVGVARALAANPKVMLLDEPFGAVDAITRLQLQNELQKIHKELGDKTFVLVTHDINEAFKLGTRVLIMDKGKICQFDTPREIMRNPKAEFVADLIATVKEQEAFWSELK